MEQVGQKDADCATVSISVKMLTVPQSASTCHSTGPMTHCAVANQHGDPGMHRMTTYKQLCRKRSVEAHGSTDFGDGL